MKPRAYATLGLTPEYLSTLNLTTEQAERILKEAATAPDHDQCAHSMIWEVVDNVATVRRWDNQGVRLPNRWVGVS